MQKDNVLISGSSGFLGAHLCRFFEEKKIPITKLTSKNCDLTNSDSLSHFTNQKYSYIFHLAAWTQAGDFCLKHPGEQWLINQKINTNMLDYWYRYQPQAKLIIMGTSCSYSPDMPLHESNYMQGEPIESLYTYAMTKRMLYQGARALHKQFGLNYLCAVPSTLYGADYHTDERQLHFIFDLIRKIMRGKEYGEQVILWGDGYQKRELIEVNDFINILWQLCECKEAENDIFNIGAGEEYTIREFAKIICNIVNYPHENITYDTTKYTGAKSKCLDIYKTKSCIDNYPLTPLTDGLKTVIQWYYNKKVFSL